MNSIRTLICVLAGVLALSNSSAAGAVRIKDITTILGARSNKLTGFGLVVGLNGTGGKSPITRQFAQNMLQKFGNRANGDERLTVKDDAKQKTDNVSVVIVTAELPAFAKRGTQIDVKVSAFDDAKSLQGGELLPTPLFGLDNEVYVMAAGGVLTGGFSFGGEATNVTKNHPTVGRVSNGGHVEEEIETPIGVDGRIGFVLQRGDYETASRIAMAIRLKGQADAYVVDATTIEIVLTPDQQVDLAGTIGRLGNITVVPDSKARVVINERTGTIVIGENVRLAKVAITHANLTVITTETPEVSQPAPFSQGETVTVPRTQTDVFEDSAPVSVFEGSTTVSDVAAALNALGVAPRDLSSIFQLLKESGALHAELEFK
jgi:flagellar P-ring protein precursor FlgI